jgi:predicted Zn-dependent peptidase
MREIEREWSAIATVAAPELENAIDHLTLRSAAEQETTEQRAAMAQDLIVNRLPRSWPRAFRAQLAAVRLRDIADACNPIVQGQPLAWVVVGDAAAFGSEIERAGLGGVEVAGDREAPA